MKTNLLRIVGIITLLLPSTSLLGCSVISQNEPNGAAKKQENLAAKKFANEQEWIVDSIGPDIAEMLIFAKYQNDHSVTQTPETLNFKTTTVDPVRNKYKFQLTLPKTKDPVTHEFTIDRYVWNPTTYQSFAQMLINKLQLKSNAISASPNNFLKALSDADSKTLYKENQRISTALSKTPLDASLHQQAALLQATFGMLELAGNYSDTRSPLNRMCAHLTIAQCLTPNKERDIVGKITDVALESMTCRDATSVTKNDLLAKSQTDPTVKSWLRALKIRSTGDYRLFDEKKQTPLEASQFGMCFATALSTDKMMDYIRKHNCTPQLRWMRIAMAGGSSVAAGHYLDSQIFPVELKDFVQDYKGFNNDTIKSQKQRIDELNKSSTRCLQTVDGQPRLLPLSWGDIAASHARHIVWAVDREYRFNEYTYGSDELAAETLKRAETQLKGLNFLPLIYLDVPVDETHKEINDRFYAAAEKLFAEQPETIPAYPWVYARDVGQYGKPPHKMQPDPESWFVPPLPMGTGYDSSHRLRLKNFNRDVAELTRLRTECPASEEICRQLALVKYGYHPTGSQWKEAYGALSDFNLHIMQQIAEGDFSDPVKYESEMEKIAQLSPDDYFTLGEYCVRHNELEKGARYLQLGEDKAEDSVNASNHSTWLAIYYYDHNEKQKALEIAKNAAEVYSEGGLHSLARLYERMGELKKAEDIYLQSKERYPDDDAMLGFFLRNKDKEKRYAEQADMMIKKAFPSGMQKIDITQLKAPPAVGLRIIYAGPEQAFLGLSNGFIVVGLNDYKVDNSDQYQIIRLMATDPKMKLTFWDGQKYKEVFAETVSNNRIGFNFDQFTK